tara:strand:+ start:1432 stop:1692 length:261 start_codon:yes stop_codon:yes gene_type:complete
MPLVNKKKFPYTVEGLIKAEAAANKTSPPSPIQADQSVYGESNASPLINPDSNTPLVEPNPLLKPTRNNSLRRKAPRPYQTKKNLY